VSIGTDWGGDDDSLAQNMNVYGQVYGQNVAGLKRRLAQQSKSDIDASKSAEAQAKSMQEDDDRAATSNLIKAGVDTVVGVGMAGVQAGFFDKGAQASSMANKSSSLDVKRQAALDAGNTKRAARLGKRSLALSRRATQAGLQSNPLYGARGEGDYIPGTETGQIGRLAQTGTTPSIAIYNEGDPLEGIRQYQEDMKFRQSISELKGG